MRYTTYILWSEKLQEYYTGQTDDFIERFRRHNNGESLSTKRGAPWGFVWSKEFGTRSEAIKLERQIKGRGAKRFLESIQGR